MKSLVLLLFLLVVVLSLAQVGKHNNGRWLQWLPPPHHNVQVCHIRRFPPNTWPKVAMHQMILPAPSSGNTGWRHYQGIDNWPNPFQSIFFGYPNFFSPWGYQPQYQNGMVPRYAGRLPMNMPLQFSSINGQWPLQPHLGPTHGLWSGQMGLTHGQWPGQMGPTNRHWPMYPHIGPTHGQWPGQMSPTNRQWPMYPHVGPTNRQWPIYPHMAPHIPPYYLGYRNHYYVK